MGRELTLTGVLQALPHLMTQDQGLQEPSRIICVPQVGYKPETAVCEPCRRPCASTQRPGVPA